MHALQAIGATPSAPRRARAWTWGGYLPHLVNDLLRGFGRGRMTRLLLTALLVAILAAAYYFRDSLVELQGVVARTAPDPKGKAAEPKGARPPPGQLVAADVAVAMTVPIQVSAIGTVQPIATVIIKSRIDGQIDKLHFEEGQEVAEGDLLFTLDNAASQASWRRPRPRLNGIGLSFSARNRN